MENIFNCYQSGDLVIDSVTLPATNKLPLPDVTGRAVAEDIIANQQPPDVPLYCPLRGRQKGH